MRARDARMAACLTRSGRGCVLIRLSWGSSGVVGRVWVGVVVVVLSSTWASSVFFGGTSKSWDGEGNNSLPCGLWEPGGGRLDEDVERLWVRP